MALSLASNNKVISSHSRTRFGKYASALAALALLAFGSNTHAQQPVLQRGYDANVSGATLTETTLNAYNVNINTFGLLFKLPVDDSIFAQPLYVPNVAILNQGTHNVVYVATMSDTVYAFDADSGAVLWSQNLASLVGAMPVAYANFAFQGNMNIVGRLGILSTPAIDPSTNVMYVVACTLENSTLAYRLHAINIASGTEPYGPGVLISASAGGATFDARYQIQRVSLALSGNQVVFAFGPLEEEDGNNDYVGWVMAYNKLTLQQSGAFATQTNQIGAGVWQSGRPPVVDSSGFVYVFTGNGYGNGYDGVGNFSETALKLDPSNGLALVDWFTPDNWSDLDNGDQDLSSSGPMLVPGTNLLVGGGKAGELYVLSTANLGKYKADDSQIVQEENITGQNEMRGGPVYWQRSTANGGPLLYDWGAGDLLKSFAFDGTRFGTSPSSQGGNAQTWPGGILTLSANGEQAGSGVVWAAVSTSGDAEDYPPTPGALYAFDAENLSQELWDSTMNPSRDGLGNFAKFVPPLVANGKVYVATFSNQVAVYGLLQAATPGFSPGPGTYSTAQSVALSDATAGAAIHYTLDGSLPTSSSTTYVTGSYIPINTTTTIRAVAVASGLANSDVTSATYTFNAAFTQATSPNTQGVVAGSAASYSTSITAVGGFSGTVTLGVSGLPAGASASFSPATISGSGSSTLTVSTASTTPTGTSTLTITATSGMLTQTSTVSLSVSTVISPSFTQATSPNMQSVVAGSAASYSTSIAAVAGFSGTVALGVSGLPAGASASFSPATISGSGSSTLTVSTTGGTPTGTSTLTITGTSGVLTETSTVSLTVNAATSPSYTLEASPNMQSVVVGSAASYSTSIASVAGFSGTVTLGVSGLPAGASASFSPATISGSGSSTLTVSTASTTPVGTSTLSITATSGALAETSTVSLSVVAAAAIGIKFVGTGTAMGSTEVAGISAQSNWNNAPGVSSAAPLVLVNQNGTSSGATVTWNTNGLFNLPITDTPGNYRMMRGYLDTVGGSTTVTVAGLLASSGGYNVYVYADGYNGGTRTGSYQISGPGISTSSINLTDPALTNFSGSFIQGNNSNGNYVLFYITNAATGFTITATPSSSTDAYLRAPLNAIQIVPQTGTTSPSFTLSATPNMQTAVAGSAASYSTSVTAVGGFSGTVTLGVSGLPAGASASFSPATISGSGSSTLTVSTASTTPVGTSTLTITATSGMLTQTSTVSLSVAAAAAIGIKFVGTGTAMGSTEVAGISAQSNWNNAPGVSSAAPLVLVNQNGTSSGATVTWNTNGIFNLPITDTPGNYRMMRGYLDTVGGITTVTVAGLPTSSGGYNVYVYADGYNGGTRTGSYQISGPGISTSSINLTDPALTNFSGSFIQGNNSNGNYVLFYITNAATGFTITATPGSSTDAFPRAPLNAIQIVPQT